MKENECTCDPKDNEGAKDGVWIDLEIFNIPFLSTMSDPSSEDFVNVKKVVERTVR